MGLLTLIIIIIAFKMAYTKENLFLLRLPKVGEMAGLKVNPLYF